MDFLFDNPLASMYGPYFLVLYIGLNIITLLVVGFMKNRLDQTLHYAMPPIPSNPDPFEIAYLRGGENELARAVVFSLIQKNLLKIINDTKTSRIYKTEGSFDKRNLKPIEQTALGWFGSIRDTQEFFQSNGLAKTLRPYYETYQARLEMQNFITNSEMKTRRSQLVWKCAAVFAGFGFYKILAAIINGYTNVIGIVVIGIIGLILIGLAGKLPRLTKLGKAYLERLQLAFDQLKTTNQFINLNQPQQNAQPTFASIDPLLLSVGVFGGGVLAGTMYGDYNQAFQKAQNHSGGSTSCSSGCGSLSSGGDGGGGGCGGCGGGCGG